MTGNISSVIYYLSITFSRNLTFFMKLCKTNKTTFSAYTIHFSIFLTGLISHLNMNQCLFWTAVVFFYLSSTFCLDCHYLRTDSSVFLNLIFSVITLSLSLSLSLCLPCSSMLFFSSLNWIPHRIRPAVYAPLVFLSVKQDGGRNRGGRKGSRRAALTADPRRKSSCFCKTKTKERGLKIQKKG